MDLQAHLKSLLGEDPLTKRFLLAVSGGLDSMVLLKLFSLNLPKENLVVAHFDHGVRKNSALDSKFVERECKKLNLKVVSGKRKKSSKESEEALRLDRMEFLEKQRQKNRCDFTVTAHHLDDQLETFLMRLLRGTGVAGLRGMTPRREVWLKPFLMLTRVEIENLAKHFAVSFREDETNTSSRYFRNRVRHELVPVLDALSEKYGGKEKFRRRFQGLVEELQSYKEGKTSRVAAEITPYWTRYIWSDWKGLSLPYRRAEIRKICKALSKVTPGREDVTRVLADLELDRQKGDIPGRVRYQVSCDWLYFQSQDQQKKLETLSILKKKKGFVCPPLEAEFGNLPSFFGNAELRFWKAGDRYRGKKLKKIFLERRIPQPERSLIPVVAKKKSSEILWFLGEAQWQPERLGLLCSTLANETVFSNRN